MDTIKSSQREIKKIVNQIVKNYHPEKIILFGSFAYGKPKPSSDIDLMIIKNTKKRRVDRIKEVLFMTEANLPFEPLVYTPKEIKQRLALGDYFIEDVINKGKPIYEK